MSDHATTAATTPQGVAKAITKANAEGAQAVKIEGGRVSAVGTAPARKTPTEAPADPQPAISESPAGASQ